MKKALHEVRWTIMFTVLIGVLVSSSMTDRIADAYNMWYDSRNPVVKMHGTIVDKTGSSIIINIKGEKFRPCRFVSMHAHTSKEGEVIDAYKERLGRIEDGSTKQVGKHDLGNWLIWPISGADTVSVSVMHDCRGRLLTAVIAEIEL